MSPGYQYRTGARWATVRRGIVDTDRVEEPIEFSSPPEFQGEAGLWTPENFFVAAVAACFVTTFLAIAGHSRLGGPFGGRLCHRNAGERRRQFSIQTGHPPACAENREGIRSGARPALAGKSGAFVCGHAIAAEPGHSRAQRCRAGFCIRSVAQAAELQPERWGDGS
jgi:hypothetical protein